MKNLEWNYWVALVLIVLGLGFLFWGAHIYMSYPGLKEIIRAARHTALLQYGLGMVCVIGSWVVLKLVKKRKKSGRKTKI